jgi:hypothetical protein
MPLIRSAKPRAFQQNIKTEMAAGRPQDQAVAIAYSEARAAKKRPEMAPEMPLHGGSPHMTAHESRKRSDM